MMILLKEIGSAACLTPFAATFSHFFPQDLQLPPLSCPPGGVIFSYSFRKLILMTISFSNLMRKKARWQPNFTQFVNRFINVEKTSSVTEFRLKLHTVECNDLVSWISMILSRNVQVLDVCLKQYRIPGPLPIPIVPCKTLVVLILCGNLMLEVPKSMCFPNLKVLHLLGNVIVLIGDNTSWTFSKGCPLLEDLTLNVINFWTDRLVDVSLPSLRKLVWRPNPGAASIVLVLNTPNLEYLGYGGFVHPSSSMCKLNSLVRADLYVKGFTYPQTSLDDRVQWLSCSLSNICCVKSLGLLLDPLEDLFKSNCSFPEFPNVTYMELMVSNCGEWGLLEFLLQQTPNLELLVCDLAKCACTRRDLVFGAEEKPLCLTQYLREI